jgi:hypothetical protein
MTVKLIDLQLIYGVAGAQEKFEQLATLLVKGEYPSATQVRTAQGDGGIDVYVGEFTDTGGIDVYQAKFFVKGIGKSQKEQIRGSFSTIQGSATFKAKSWTLCLPINMSAEETEWFEGWKAKQTGIDIRQPWDATKLEFLLLQPKNRGVKEGFFKEEYLTQIREMHWMMEKLVNRVEEWFRGVEADQKHLKESDALSRQAEYLQQFVDALRVHYLGAVGRAATKLGFSSKRPSHHWEVVIRPSWIPDHPRIDTLKECWSIVGAASVRSNGWTYPVIREEIRQTGQDWIGATGINKLKVESWRLSPSGVFAHMFHISGDAKTQGFKPDSWPWDLPKGFVPQHFLDVDAATRALTHAFRFAASLADKAFDPGEGTVEVSVCVTGTCDRVLITWDDPERLMECCRAFAPNLEHTWPCPSQELRSAPDDFALKAAIWLFERFNWHDVSAEVVTRIQKKQFAESAESL